MAAVKVGMELPSPNPSKHVIGRGIHGRVRDIHAPPVTGRVESSGSEIFEQDGVCAGQNRGYIHRLDRRRRGGRSAPEQASAPDESEDENGHGN